MFFVGGDKYSAGRNSGASGGGGGGGVSTGRRDDNAFSALSAANAKGRDAAEVNGKKSSNLASKSSTAHGSALRGGAQGGGQGGAQGGESTGGSEPTASTAQGYGGVAVSYTHLTLPTTPYV